MCKFSTQRENINKNEFVITIVFLFFFSYDKNIATVKNIKL